ncbi:MAG TPA: efflux RND transporter periplasmic adaptor subunit [Steroidobacteraceae bacterium]|nr:efflux RND transporter periplasmic adaptor subunit [Steroidobacteraceae bacterium]
MSTRPRATDDLQIVMHPRAGWRQPTAVLLGLLVACGHQNQAPPPPGPPVVKVTTLTPQAVTLTTDLPGRTVAFKVAEIRPQVSGVIQKRMFVEGSDVKEGQQLYQIDPALYRAAYESAAAAAASSKVLVERYKPLAEANAVSKQDYDNAIAAAAQNKASADTARINLVYTRLLAPIGGRIGRSSVTEGALVTAAQATALATLQQLDPIYVDVSQPSAVLLRLKREMAAGELEQTNDNQAQVHLMLEDGSAYQPSGKLQFAEVSVDETTGSVTLRALFPNPDKVLLPGMFVREQIVEGRRADALLVPQLAVTHDPRGGATTLVVDADGKVELRQLVTERAIGDKWLVTAGVKAGERVIVEGVQYAKPGAPVRAEEWQPPADKQPTAPGP